MKQKSTIYLMTLVLFLSLFVSCSKDDGVVDEPTSKSASSHRE